MTITDAIREVLSTGDLHPLLVNNGGCAIFAAIVQEKFPDAEIQGVGNSIGGWHHVFLLYGGRYYDAECHDGVTDWKNLPIWKRLKKPRRLQVTKNLLL